MDPTRRATVLLCSIPVHGHVAPMLEVARHLAAAGADVRMLTGARFAQRVRQSGAGFRPLPADADFDDRDLNTSFPGRAQLTGLAQLRYDIGHMFLDATRGQLRALQAAIEERRPDVVIAETGFIAAPVLAASPATARPAVFALSVVPLAVASRDTAPYGLGLRPLGGPVGRLRNAVLSTLVRRVMLRGNEREAGGLFLELTGTPMPGSMFDLPLLADAYLQASVPSFEYPRSDLPAHVRFVGPICRSAESDAGLPDWWGDLDGRRVVHVTQGTLANADLTELIVPTVRALAEGDLLVVVATGGRDRAELERADGDPLPSNVRVADFLPYDALLPRVDAMVTNGGYGGVHYALRYGIPLVVAGRTEDKMEVTARVGCSGAGIDLHAQRPKPAAIARAVDRVLIEPSYRTNSRRIGRDIATSGGVHAIASLVQAAARARTGTPA
jgi:UDP:flavonoid glycosyltransferase YjiC (YdhE family)